jgi:UDP-N-acetylglucosamine 4,6-dehydratase/5-epimerase
MSSSSLDNKIVLVTGGTGSVGNLVVRELLQRGASVVVYSRDQNKQHKMKYDVASRRVVYKQGDICDPQILSRAMKGVEMVIHCAAAKHVPLCETNPDSAIKTNVEGTRNVLVAALQRGVKKCLMLSTDKAVNPSSVMGATKLLAERLFLEFSECMPSAIVRLGNVFASSGSVVPMFQARIKDKLPLIVNDPSAERFFISQKEAARFIVESLENMQGGEVFVKKMKLANIMELAKVVSPAVDYPIRIGQPSQGEKTLEHLFTQQERWMMEEKQGHFVIDRKPRTAPIPEYKPDYLTTQELQQMLKGAK